MSDGIEINDEILNSGGWELSSNASVKQIGVDDDSSSETSEGGSSKKKLWVAGVLIASAFLVLVVGLGAGLSGKDNQNNVSASKALTLEDCIEQEAAELEENLIPTSWPTTYPPTDGSGDSNDEGIFFPLVGMGSDADMEQMSRSNDVDDRRELRGKKNTDDTGLVHKKAMQRLGTTTAAAKKQKERKLDECADILNEHKHSSWSSSNGSKSGKGSKCSSSSSKSSKSTWHSNDHMLMEGSSSTSKSSKSKSQDDDCEPATCPDPDTWTTPLINEDGTSGSIGECQRGCASDEDCDGSPTATDKETKLTCFQVLTVGRNKNPSPDIVPGCAGIVPRAGTEVGYCAFVPENYLRWVGKDTTLQRCEAGCDSDGDCAGELVCFERDNDNGIGPLDAVPGCCGCGSRKRDYCIDPDDTVIETTCPVGDPDQSICGSTDLFGEGCCLDSAGNRYSSIVNTEVFSAEDCKIACVGVSTCGLRGYDYDENSNECACLYDDGEVPSPPPDGWAVGNSTGTGPVNATDATQCESTFCHSYEDDNGCCQTSSPTRGPTSSPTSSPTPDGFCYADRPVGNGTDNCPDAGAACCIPNASGTTVPGCKPNCESCSAGIASFNCCEDSCTDGQICCKCVSGNSGPFQCVSDADPATCALLCVGG